VLRAAKGSSPIGYGLPKPKTEPFHPTLELCRTKTDPFLFRSGQQRSLRVFLYMTSRLFARDELAYLISQGHVLVVHRDVVYKLNRWLLSHPGGALAILHFVGRDAWCEIEAYHSDTALRKMSAFAVGRVASKSDRGWDPLVPPVQLGWPVDADSYRDVPSIDETLRLRAANGDRSPLYPLLGDLEPPSPPKNIDPVQQHRQALAWGALHDEIKIAGLYKPTPWSNYRWELVRYSVLACLFAVSFYYARTTCSSFVLRELVSYELIIDL
jgi:delta8-fatty-acid desaturase